VEALKLTVEFDREDNGRWVADVPELPGVMAYGESQGDARRRVHALALHVLAGQLEAGERDQLPGLSLSDRVRVHVQQSPRELELLAEGPLSIADSQRMLGYMERDELDPAIEAWSSSPVGPVPWSE